jgi:hypothetical protein
MIEGWTATRVIAPNTHSGNPMRAWIVTAHYAPVGTVFVDEGYAGFPAISEALNVPLSTAQRIASECAVTIQVTAKEFRALAREHVMGANSAEFRRSVRETVI